jgi:hypothetical protein
VGALDASVGSFYRKYGFIELDDGCQLFLPMTTIAKAFAQ